jgi:hypothetical protein
MHVVVFTMGVNVGESFCRANGNVEALKQQDVAVLVSNVKLVMEASIADVLEDQYGDIRFQT